MLTKIWKFQHKI